MQFRRSLALSTATVALAVAGLSSCGFDYATDREYTPAAGVSDHDGSVKVLSAVIVSTEPGSGTFIASLSNRDQDNEITFTTFGLTGIEPVEFEPVPIAAGALVNLAEPPLNLEVTGDFQAGDFVEVSAGFDNGETSTLTIPVVPNSGIYADLDGPAPAEDTADEATGETTEESGE